MAGGLAHNARAQAFHMTRDAAECNRWTSMVRPDSQDTLRGRSSRRTWGTLRRPDAAVTDSDDPDRRRGTTSGPERRPSSRDELAE